MVSGAASGDPVVRYSRMWCPHDIGRDSWVWGEQGTLGMMNSPHEVGDEAFHRVDPVDGRKRGGPWVRWLLNLIISLINNYCWARWTTSGGSRLGSVTILQNIDVKNKQKPELATRCFFLLLWRCAVGVADFVLFASSCIFQLLQ